MDTNPPFDQQDMRPTAWLADLRLALVFLTRIPVPLTAHLPDGALLRALRVFPLVGALVGAVAALIWWAGNLLHLPPFVSALLAVGSMILLCGALHEDGLADVADGFGGGSTREKTLAIMRDSVLGTYGVLALIFSTGLRVSLLAAFDPMAGIYVLIAAAMVSRASMAVVLYGLPAAREEGLAASLQPSLRIVIQSLALGIGGLFLLIPPFLALAGLVLGGALLGGLMAKSRQKIGGQTGDVCGTGQQIVEVSILLGALAASQI